MIKRTLYFENPAYLSVRLGQLVIKKPDSDETVKTVPIEDIGMIVLDNSRITLTHGLMSALTENNCAVVS